jgi:hypothetical protein
MGRIPSHRASRACPDLIHAWPRCGLVSVVSYPTPSHHRDGNTADQNLNEIKQNIESQSNLKAWRYNPTRARDYQPET